MIEKENGNLNHQIVITINTVFLTRDIQTFIFIFQSHQTIEKKPHFICSDLTLFIVPFFLFFPFLFSFSSGRGRRPPAPSNDAPEDNLTISSHWILDEIKF